MTEQESYGFAGETATATHDTGVFEDVTTDPETGTTVASYDYTTEHLSVALPELVARREQCHPCSLSPLYEHVDPEAVDDLFADAGPESGVTVSFQYEGYEVSVERDWLSVTPVR